MTDYSEYRILYVATEDINMRDIPEALMMLGCQVLEINHTIKSQIFNWEDCEFIKDCIKESGATHVITYDFIPSVAKACHDKECNYISWVYDCPQKELYSDYAKYSTNFVFVFDKMEWMQLKEAGITNVYHMPLAVMPQKAQAVLNDKFDYEDEVSFVGQLYSIAGFESIINGMSDENYESLLETVNNISFNWPDYRREDYIKYSGSMSQELIDYLDSMENQRIASEAPYMGARHFYEAAFLARIIANRERCEILNSLAQISNVSLYTRDTDLSMLDSRINNKSGVGFDKAVLNVYQKSKININVTLHCIESGICQRVFDVLNAGGFLITNYQKELEDFFEIGKDLIVYHNLEELTGLVEYYLTHDEERKQIALNGQSSVWKKHNYMLRMVKALEKVERYHREKDIKTIIMTTPADFERLSPLYEKTIQNLYPRKLYFLGSEKVGELIKSSSINDRVGFINEEEILPFLEVHEVMKKALGVNELPRGITGWYYQQFLKMKYAFICENDYYMTWDGDTVPCKAFDMFADDNNTPYFDLKSEYHEEYFVTLARLFPGMKKVIGASFISEHMMFSKDIMIELVREIENNKELTGSKFYEKIINAVAKDKLTANSFSEFETYGTYVALKYPAKYKLREWHSFRYGAYFMHPETMSDEDYEWLSRDFDAISFEKNQSVRADHENLFQNKEYQTKLSARQMLEVVQETFEEGFTEEWSIIKNN